MSPTRNAKRVQKVHSSQHIQSDRESSLDSVVRELWKQNFHGFARGRLQSPYTGISLGAKTPWQVSWLSSRSSTHASVKKKTLILCMSRQSDPLPDKKAPQLILGMSQNQKKIFCKWLSLLEGTNGLRATNFETYPIFIPNDTKNHAHLWSSF